MPVIFITATDTGIGKTYATGLIARYLQEKGKTVITQKLVQTGSADGSSEDIIMHRALMGIEPTHFDADGTTCPYVFKLPASPHLAAAQENARILISKIKEATDVLRKQFEYVLVEGVGGLMVPILKDYTVLDYLRDVRYDIIVVTSAKLGSINHTLLTLNAAVQNQIQVKGVVYNLYPETDNIITRDSLMVIKDNLKKLCKHENIVEMPKLDINKSLPEIDFEKLVR